MADESFSGLNEQAIKNAQKIKFEIGEIQGSFARINRTLGTNASLLTGISNELTKISTATNNVAILQEKAKNSTEGTAKALKEQQTQLNIVRNLNAQIDVLYERAEAETGKTKANLKTQAQNLAEARDRASQLANIFGDIVEDSSKLDKSTLFFSKISEVLKGTPILKSFAGPFEAASKAARQTVLDNAKIANIKGNISSLTAQELNAGRGLTKERLQELGLTTAAKNQSGAAAAAALRNYQAVTKESSVLMKGLGAGFKSIGEGVSGFFKGGGWIGLAITGAIKLFQFIKDAMFGASKQVAEFQRNLMVSSEEAEKIRQRAYDISARSSELADTQGKIVILQKQIVEAQNATNAAFETSIDFTSELFEGGEKLLAQSAILKDNMGLEAEAQAELTRESIRTGKEIEQITKSSYGNIAAIGLGKKIQFDVNKLLTEATKIQGNLRLNFKGSTEELAKAVAQAKLLGVNLTQLEKVQNSLLNFEESISAELEAELLTGRDFNLERARTLALEGDLIGMAEALNAQGITYNNLQNYNIIQRQAIAKALGMEVNELADALKKQEEYNALQLRARQIGIVNKDIEKMSLQEIFQEGKNIGREESKIIEMLGDEIYKRKLAEDAQTKFNKALEMAKEQFEQFVSSGVLDRFAIFLTQFINTVAKDGLRAALFEDYGKAISEAQLKQTIESANQMIGKDVSLAEGPITKEKVTIARDIQSAKRDVSESEKLTTWDIIRKAFFSFDMNPVNDVMNEKRLDTETKELSKSINQLNQILDKGITANTYVDTHHLRQAENIRKTTS
jgi:hypothetical protein